MQENLSLARPYAKALFDSAVEQGTLDAWDSRLKHLKAVMQDKEVQKLLANPFLDASFWTGLLAACLKESVHAEFTSFIKVLHRYRRISVIPAIQTLFHEYKLRKDDCMAMTIRSAEALSPEQKAKLKVVLEEKYKHGLELSYEINPTLIAGLQFVIGDQLLDGSLKKRLERMKDTLTASV